MDLDKIIAEITDKVISETSVAGTAAVSGSYDASYGKYMDHTVLKPATEKSTVAKF